MPYWRLVFEPEETVEAVVGWFRASCSLEETVSWHQREMEEHGWIRDTAKGHIDGSWVGLNFRNPETGVQVEMSIRRRKHLNDTSIMIRRVIKHPWSPTVEEPVAETPELSLPDEER